MPIVISTGITPSGQPIPPFGRPPPPSTSSFRRPATNSIDRSSSDDKTWRKTPEEIAADMADVLALRIYRVSKPNFIDGSTTTSLVGGEKFYPGEKALPQPTAVTRKSIGEEEEDSLKSYTQLNSYIPKPKKVDLIQQFRALRFSQNDPSQVIQGGGEFEQQSPRRSPRLMKIHESDFRRNRIRVGQSLAMHAAQPTVEDIVCWAVKQTHSFKEEIIPKLLQLEENLRSMKTALEEKHVDRRLAYKKSLQSSSTNSSLSDGNSSPFMKRRSTLRRTSSISSPEKGTMTQFEKIAPPPPASTAPVAESNQLKAFRSMPLQSQFDAIEAMGGEAFLRFLNDGLRPQSSSATGGNTSGRSGKGFQARPPSSLNASKPNPRTARSISKPEGIIPVPPPAVSGQASASNNMNVHRKVAFSGSEIKIAVDDLQSVSSTLNSPLQLLSPTSDQSPSKNKSKNLEIITSPKQTNSANSSTGLGSPETPHMTKALRMWSKRKRQKKEQKEQQSVKYSSNDPDNAEDISKANPRTKEAIRKAHIQHERAAAYTRNLFNQASRQQNQLLETVERNRKSVAHNSNLLLRRMRSFKKLTKQSAAEARDINETHRITRRHRMQTGLSFFSQQNAVSVPTEKLLSAIQSASDDASQKKLLERLFSISWFPSVLERLRDVLRRFGTSLCASLLRFVYVSIQILALDGPDWNADMFFSLLQNPEIFSRDDFRKNFVQNLLDIFREGLSISASEYIAFFESHDLPPPPEILNELRQQQRSAGTHGGILASDEIPETPIPDSTVE